jgi:hypothetical protein
MRNALADGPASTRRAPGGPSASQVQTTRPGTQPTVAWGTQHAYGQACSSVRALYGIRDSPGQPGS